MGTISPSADPLVVLPPEIVLRILEFTPTATLASLTAVSNRWHQFIDDTHQQAIYGSESRTEQPLGGARDFSFLSDRTSYARLFDSPASWKDLCKRQTLLGHNWAASRPTTREWILQAGNEPVWRFRADFKRRFFVSTSNEGGLYVTDMDTGEILWQLPSTQDQEGDAVRPFAHLEYQDGMAVFDSEGDVVEVWHTDFDGAARGQFERIAVLRHDCQTMGFQLSYGTLCVVSIEGKGFVYDMTQRPPKRTTQIEIEQGAVGHLDQNEDVVIYSMGERGYHVYNKTSGAFMGTLQPSHCTDKYHIRHVANTSPPSQERLEEAIRRGSAPTAYLPGPARSDSLKPISILPGPLQPPRNLEYIYHDVDDWGAGMLDGSLFVGVSRAGRVFICRDWRQALHGPDSLATHSSLLECESDGSTFDLGGWLSVRNHRIMFEIKDQVYVVALNKQNQLLSPTRASYSLMTGAASHLTVPVSFMALFDDAIMTTYTTIGWRRPLPPDVLAQPPEQLTGRMLSTKAIRIICFAPDISNQPSSGTGGSQTRPLTMEERSDLDQDYPVGSDVWYAQENIFRLSLMFQ